MTRNVSILTLGCLICSGAVHADEVTWTGAVDASTFGIAGNWTPRAIPGSGDHAIVPILATITFDVDATLADLTIDGTGVDFLLAARTLTTTEFSISTNGSADLTVRDGSVVSGMTPLVDDLVIAGAARSVGSLTLTDSNSLTSLGGMVVGSVGTGSLDVSGASLQSYRLRAGDLAGAFGHVTVGAGSTWIDESKIFIGNYGDGTLTVASDATIDSAIVTIGDEATSTGSATVSGPSTAWTNLGQMTVGNHGVGALTLDAGAHLTTNRMKIGDEIGSAGTVVVTGAATSWADGLEIFVGNQGHGGLTIDAAASVVGVTATLADDPGAQGDVQVLNSATWTLDNQLVVADFGSATLLLAGGGRLETGGMIAADEIGGSAELIMQGTGTSWTDHGELVIGNNGSATMVIDADASLSGILLTLADNAGSSAALTLSNGATLSLGSVAVIANSGSATFTINSGATALTSRIKLADGPTSIADAVIEGSGTAVIDGTEIVVGNRGTATMIVRDGAHVTTFGSNVGEDPEATGTLQVADAMFSVTDQLVVGDRGVGVMRLEDGAQADAFRATIGDNDSSDGLVQMMDGSSLTITGQLSVGNAGSGVLRVHPGAVVSAGAYVQSPTGTLHVSIGANHQPISGTIIAGLGGVLDIDIAPGFVPQVGESYDILTSGSVAGMFSELDLPVSLDAVVESDRVRVEVIASPGDATGDGVVNIFDLLALLGAWGPCVDGDACLADVNGSGTIDGDDLQLVLQTWLP